MNPKEKEVRDRIKKIKFNKLLELNRSKQIEKDKKTQLKRIDSIIKESSNLIKKTKPIKITKPKVIKSKKLRPKTIKKLERPKIKTPEVIEPLPSEILNLSFSERREFILNKVKIMSESRTRKFTNQELALRLGMNVAKYKYYTRSDEEILKHKLYAEDFKTKQQSKPFFFLKIKIERFLKRSKVNIPFDFNDVIKKFGENPVCYLTGLPIDYNKTETYQLDHFIPASKGGPSDLDNMRLAHPMANEMKRDYDLNKFIEICSLIANRKEILLNPEKM